MPIDMRLGKLRGNTSADAMPIGPFRTYSQPVNLRDLEARFEAGAEVTLEALKEAGLIATLRKDVKILGSGELTKKLSVTAHRFSASAREKIEAAGGTATALVQPKPPRRSKKPRRPKPVADDGRGRGRRRRQPPTSPPASRRDGRRGAGRGLARAVLARQRLARARAAAARPLHGLDPRDLPARLLDARAGRQLRHDQGLLLEPGRQRPRPAEPVLGRRALAVLAVRARDHAVRHGLDHPPADDRGDPAARPSCRRRASPATPRSTSTRAT